MSIIVEDLTKIYGAQAAVDNISFQAKKGEILGLLGPNGAGKTTTMKMITCFMPATAGVINVCGLEAGKDDFAIRQKIGYLPEHNPLYGFMYVKEYLTFVSRIHGLKNNKVQIKNIIERVGLGREQSKKISELSKGYKQRVGIAQAIIHDPEVLILDEPISGLDPNQLLEIRNLITDLKKDKTIIFSSHILQEVESICDSVVILDKGQVVALDTITNLGEQVSDNTKIIKIELLNAMNTAVFESIVDINSVNHLQGTIYAIEVKNNVDVREKIFDLVVKQNNKLLSMQMEDNKLENIFKSVTTENS